jgi:ribosomal protein S27AE
MSDKRYLGDGCYVEVDDVGIVLTTENGIRVTNRIVFEVDTLVAFLMFLIARPGAAAAMRRALADADAIKAVDDADNDECPKCGALKRESMAREGDVEYCGACGYGKPHNVRGPL